MVAAATQASAGVPQSADPLARLDKLPHSALPRLCAALGFADFTEAQAALLTADLARAAPIPDHNVLCALLEHGLLPVLKRLERAAPRDLVQAMAELAQARPYALCEAVALPLFAVGAALTGAHRTVLAKLLLESDNSSEEGGSDRGTANAAPGGGAGLATVFLDLWAGTSQTDEMWTELQLELLEAAVRTCAVLPATAAARAAAEAQRQATTQARSLRFCKLLLTLIRQHGPALRPHAAALRYAASVGKAFLAKSVLTALAKLE